MCLFHWKAKWRNATDIARLDNARHQHEKVKENLVACNAPMHVVFGVVGRHQLLRHCVFFVRFAVVVKLDECTRGARPIVCTDTHQ